jgi:hypothetical protein
LYIRKAPGSRCKAVPDTGPLIINRDKALPGPATACGLTQSGMINRCSRAREMTLIVRLPAPGKLAHNCRRKSQPYHIADEMQQGVLIDRLRPVRLTIAAHVDRDSVKSSRGQHGKLMPP